MCSFGFMVVDVCVVFEVVFVVEDYVVEKCVCCWDVFSDVGCSEVGVSGISLSYFKFVLLCVVVGCVFDVNDD